MNLSQEIVNHLALYLSGGLSLADFREWQVKMFLKRNSLTADDRKFLFEFERHYGELSIGLTEAAFKSLLRSLAAPPVIEVPTVALAATLLVLSTSSSVSYRQESTQQVIPNMAELLPA